MTQHTPGPWIVTPFGDITDTDESFVGVAFRENKAERAANGRLIAAAPLMLEALKRIRDNCADNDPENWIWRTAEQAIAQAEGK